ncbi:MAG: acyltransferase [bacterium]|nr:acyltransferase [bacterium]MCP5044840.1 acyltransferase [bacterium]
MTRILLVIGLRVIQTWDRLRLWWLVRRYPGLVIHPSASTNLAVAQFDLAPDAKLVIGACVAAERIKRGVRFRVGAGGSVVVGDNVWLRSELGPLFLRAFDGGQIRIGRDCQLNACMLTAKQEIDVGERVLIGMGTRIFDSDQHAVDVAHPEVTLPVRIEDSVWIAADATILRGSIIGREAVVGARSLVRGAVEPHTAVSGVPARNYGKVGDRANVKL